MKVNKVVLWVDMNSPCCHQPLTPVNGSNLDMCPECGKWFLIDEERGTLTEVM